MMRRFFLRLAFGCSLLAATPFAFAADPMLPKVFSGQVDVTGWLMSEKLDGVRARWDGRQLWSKNNHLLHPPEAFVSDLPGFALEGEIWGGRGTFEQTAAVLQRDRDDQGWLQLQFAVFDVPEAEGGFTARIVRAREWFAAHPSDHAFVIPQHPIRSRAHLRKELERVETLGGEGLMVRRPDALYRAGRSSEILKVKRFDDAEAVVVAHLPGQGRNHGKLGSLLAELPDGTQFKIGTGFTDCERSNPPPVGSVITFRHDGFFRSGIPRFPSYLRIRRDSNLSME